MCRTTTPAGWSTSATTSASRRAGGTDFDTIYPTVAGNGFASVQAGQIMGAAVGTFCPDMEAAFDRWTNS